MDKEFTIEVPMYTYPVNYLMDIQQNTPIHIVLYGGMPNSPLNGGRFNYSIDGFPLRNRILYKITKNQLSQLIKTFNQTIVEVNKNNIPFFITFTNMFIEGTELTSENLKPLDFLVDCFHTYGIKNGVIINNPLLENFLRDRYKTDLAFVSSCTKYVSPKGILSPRETIPLYVKDSKKYDYVVLTPQHSRRKEVIIDVLSQARDKIIAICNSYCSDQCNSYHHYVFMSQENKNSLLELKTLPLLKNSYNFLLKRATQCSVFRYQLQKINIDKIVKMQLEAGLVNFKIGRGLGAKCLDRVISLIQNHCPSQ